MWQKKSLSCLAELFMTDINVFFSSYRPIMIGWVCVYVNMKTHITTIWFFITESIYTFGFHLSSSQVNIRNALRWQMHYIV